MPNITPDTILDFWFSERVKPLQFQKNVEFDIEIRNKFLSSYEEAIQSKLNSWQKTAKGSLALIILLDQFPRNIFRNTPKSFASDKQAINITKAAIDNNFDSELSNEQRVFLYMPFMHSENLEEQELSVKLYSDLGAENNLKFAIAHYDIIKRFGRFSHRNNTLGRDSTPEEIEFLKGPNSGF